MEVQILSRETVKPASWSIPHDHLKTFRVSLLDKLSPHVYTPIIFFYSTNEADGHFNKEDAIAGLKLSLSETLGRFYMLAGRIKGDMIHCSSEGALFVKAGVNVPMAEFLKQPKLQLLAQFIHFPYVFNEPLDATVQIAVQVNTFTSGGIAIGLSFLHNIIDGATMSSFIKSWAASTKGTPGKLVRANYISVSSLFPQREISPCYALFSRESPFLTARGEISSTRRFVFDAMAISNLKAKAKSVSVPNPTSVEVVTCFIWKYAMQAARRKSADKKKDLLMGGQEPPTFVHREWSSVLTHIVNMRRRIEPPLPEDSVGNIIWRTWSHYEASNTEINLNDLEKVLRQSMSKINTDFVRKITGDDGFETVLSSLQQLHEHYGKDSDSYLFTSWRNMGLKEVDFGWGKPTWISGGGSVFDSAVRNFVILMETTFGDGIEAWVVLDEEAMKSLEHDPEFLRFASLNPSVPVGLNGISSL